MGKLLMKKNELKLEKSTATMLYPTLLTKINNGDIKNARKAFDKIPEENIDEKFIEAVRKLAEQTSELSPSEDLDRHIQETLRGGLDVPVNDTPKDFIRKLLSL